MKITVIAVFCFIFTFLIDLTIGIQQYIPQSISKAILLSSVTCSYIYLTTRLSKNNRKDLLSGIILIYIFFLLIRLFYDFVIQDIFFFMYKSPVTLFFFVLNLIVFPAFFYKKYIVDIDIKLLNLYLLIYLGFFLILSILGNLSGTIVANTNDRYTGYGELDIIYYGHLGVSYIIIGISIFINSKNKIFKTGGLIICCLLGFLAIVFSGSRGPFLALGCVLLYKYFSLIKSLKTFVWLVIIGGFVLIFFIDIILYINDFLIQFDITSFFRVVNSLTEETSTSGRDILFFNALNDFVENPVFGKSYLLDDGSYVHNIILEQFRALGFIGGSLFLIINIWTIKRGFHILKICPQYSLIPMLFMQYFIYGMFSRTIIALPQYWLCLFVLNNLFYKYARNFCSYSYLQK